MFPRTSVELKSIAQFPSEEIKIFESNVVQLPSDTVVPELVSKRYFVTEDPEPEPSEHVKTTFASTFCHAAL